MKLSHTVLHKLVRDEMSKLKSGLQKIKKAKEEELAQKSNVLMSNTKPKASTGLNWFEYKYALDMAFANFRTELRYPSNQSIGGLHKILDNITNNVKNMSQDTIQALINYLLKQYADIENDFTSSLSTAEEGYRRRNDVDTFNSKFNKERKVTIIVIDELHNYIRNLNSKFLNFSSPIAKREYTRPAAAPALAAPAPAAAAADDEDSDDDGGDGGGGDGGGGRTGLNLTFEEQLVAPKRGRGRPRKVGTVAASAEGLANSLLEVQDAMSSAARASQLALQTASIGDKKNTERPAATERGTLLSLPAGASGPLPYPVPIGTPFQPRVSPSLTEIMDEELKSTDKPKKRK